MTCQQEQPTPRKQAIIRPDLATRMKLAWKFSRARGLPCFAVFSIIILPAISLQPFFLAWGDGPAFQLVPMLLWLLLFMANLGVAKSILL